MIYICIPFIDLYISFRYPFYICISRISLYILTIFLRRWPTLDQKPQPFAAEAKEWLTNFCARPQSLHPTAPHRSVRPGSRHRLGPSTQIPWLAGLVERLARNGSRRLRHNLRTWAPSTMELLKDLEAAEHR